jgi:hypothetical protein
VSVFGGTQLLKSNYWDAAVDKNIIICFFGYFKILIVILGGTKITFFKWYKLIVLQI